jgi:N-acetyl-anhydromuramyl-L-alanine amidase AmpD
MDVDNLTYELIDNNYHTQKFEKNQIVIGNTFSEKFYHFNGWLTRLDGGYTKTANYTVTRKGEVYEHFNPIYYSDFLNEKRIDKKIISIVLENQGWLKKDLLTNKYFDWVGNIYKRRVNVVEKRWRGQQYWDPYTPKQFKTTINLVKYLCETYNIDKKCVGHNTYIKGVEEFNGITYRSNYYKDNTDVNPSWNFNKFKSNIEKL